MSCHPRFQTQGWRTCQWVMHLQRGLFLSGPQSVKAGGPSQTARPSVVCAAGFPSPAVPAAEHTCNVDCVDCAPSFHMPSLLSRVKHWSLVCTAASSSSAVPPAEHAQHGMQNVACVCHALQVRICLCKFPRFGSVCPAGCPCAVLPATKHTE